MPKDPGQHPDSLPANPLYQWPLGATLVSGYERCGSLGPTS